MVAGMAWGKVTIDCVNPERNAQFWGSLLGLRVSSRHRGWFDTAPSVPGGPSLNFQPVPSRPAGKTPVHLDIWVEDVAQVRSLAEALGAKYVGEDPTSEHTAIVMTDPEGIEFCIIGPVPDRAVPQAQAR